MKKRISVFCIILSLSFLLVGCEFSGKITETEHIHQWQDVSGEHASICTECGEKALKPEACNFVSEGCEMPKVCTVCHAVSNEPPEEHDWHFSDRYSDCWSTTETYTCSKCNMQQTTHGDYALPSHIWREETEGDKTTFTCTKCNESNTFISEIREFSYTQALEEYKIGEPGVKHEGFNNPAIEVDITRPIDAITRAKLELTIEYDTISVSHDETSNMWRVDFWVLDVLGGGQSVYVNGNGLTCYIVYGE